MFQQRQFLPLMGPEEHGFQRIQRGSDRLESLINGLCASEGPGAARASSPEAMARQSQPSPAISILPQPMPWGKQNPSLGCEIAW